MSRGRLLAKLVKVRQRQRDLAAATCWRAEAAMTAAATRTTVASRSMLALDDSYGPRLRGVAGDVRPVVEIFERERHEAQAEVQAALRAQAETAASLAEARRAQAARERALRGAETVTDRWRSAHEREEARREQSASDDLAAGRARRSA